MAREITKCCFQHGYPHKAKFADGIIRKTVSMYGQ